MDGKTRSTPRRCSLETSGALVSLVCFAHRQTCGVENQGLYVEAQDWGQTELVLVREQDGLDRG